MLDKRSIASYRSEMFRVKPAEKQAEAARDLSEAYRFLLVKTIFKIGV